MQPIMLRTLRTNPRSTSSTCSHTHLVLAYILAITKAMPRVMPSNASRKPKAIMYSTLWAGMLSACRPSNTQSRQANIHAKPQPPMSIILKHNSVSSVSHTTGRVKSTQQIQATTSGLSGSLCSSSKKASPMSTRSPSGSAPTSARYSPMKKCSTLLRALAQSVDISQSNVAQSDSGYYESQNMAIN